MSPPELARRVTHLLAAAADKVGVDYAKNYCFHFEDLSHAVLLAARGAGGLPSAQYRQIFSIYSIFKQARLARGRDEAVAEARIDG